MSDIALPVGFVAVPDVQPVAPSRPRLRIAVRPTGRRVAGIAFISATVTLAALFAAAVFQTVERRVERALFDFQCVLGGVLDDLRDGVSVGWACDQGAQDQHG